LSNPANRQTDRHRWKHNLLGGGNDIDTAVAATINTPRSTTSLHRGQNTVYKKVYLILPLEQILLQTRFFSMAIGNTW